MPFTENFDEAKLTLTAEGSGDELGPLTSEKSRTVYIICQGEFKSIADRCFSSYVSVISIILPESITSLGDNIIENCESLLNITLPMNVQTVSYGQSFDWVYSLQKILVDPRNMHFKDINGVLFSKDMKRLYYVPGGRQEKVYNVPYGVEIIDIAGFGHSRNLNSIIIPPTVRSIDQFFGVYCVNLESVFINQCKRKVKFNTANLFYGTGKSESIIHYEERCIFEAKTCLKRNNNIRYINLGLVSVLLSV